ncbi:MAG: hypothetical protein CMH82_00030 [Nocardioides sp.]|nr:hypothetical protein [Nocardioides sp.]|tara:strand:+ start:6752 stop:7222 length:471 start_codon:yes stop_codon:yes gene_type:complete
MMSKKAYFIGGIFALSIGVLGGMGAVLVFNGDGPSAPDVEDFKQAASNDTGLVFTGKRPECSREPPKIGVLTQFGAYGTARMAYKIWLQEKQMAGGTCDCLTSLGTYDDFLRAKFDTSASAMTDDEFQEMRLWQQSYTSDFAAKYMAYFDATCRKG